MDILNWLYLKRQQLIKTTVNNPDTDLLVLGAEVPFTKRDDGYQNYAMTVADFTDQIKGYKSYTALITQSGINPPVATVLENTLDVNITFTYDAVGQYSALLDQAIFPDPNQYVTVSQNMYVNGANEICNVNALPVFFNAIGIISYENLTPADSIIGDYSPCVLEIRVYN